MRAVHTSESARAHKLAQKRENVAENVRDLATGEKHALECGWPSNRSLCVTFMSKFKQNEGARVR